MTPENSQTEDNYEIPFPTDDDSKHDEPEARDQSQLTDPADQSELAAAAQAWEGDGPELEDNPELIEIAQPFVGRWKELISTTNWEKGRIISQWREALIDSGASANQYSDDAWSRRVGGVTAPHVGRLRRVYDRFSSTYETYPGLYWSHFLAALDWDDAPLWLEGASRENWSVANMREQRWQAHGAVDSQRPTASEIVEVDTDEDVVLPAQGGGKTKEYGDQGGVASGPLHEEPDFGEEEELMSLAGGNPPAATSAQEAPEASPTQPFAGLPELPDDLADAIEDLKLTILRHKSAGWQETDAATIHRYLDAISMLLD